MVKGPAAETRRALRLSPDRTVAGPMRLVARSPAHPKGHAGRACSAVARATVRHSPGQAHPATGKMSACALPASSRWCSSSSPGPP